MKRQLLENLAESKRKADGLIASMTEEEKDQLEKNWDIEHAYYSSALEGSKLDKKTFEELAKEVK